MAQVFGSLGREVAVINMDPANDILPYTCSVDISELISVEDVMSNLHLGPNGGLVYCMEYLEKNIEWLKERLESVKDKYMLFDFPGQVGNMLCEANLLISQQMKCILNIKLIH